MRKGKIAIFSMIVSLGILFSGALPALSAEAAQDTVRALSGATAEDEVRGYGDYSAAQNGLPAGASDIVLLPEAAAEKDGRRTWQISVPSDGLYGLLLCYRCADGQDAVLRIEVDGAVPFTEAARVTFPAFWTDADERRTDGEGNEFSPEQVVCADAAWSAAQDRSGRYEHPYAFALTAGAHELSLTAVRGSAQIVRLRLRPATAAPAYTLPSDLSAYDTSAAEPIVLEGEAAAVKNDRALVAMADGTSALVEPHEPGKTLLNYIGGTNWERPGAALTWRFSVKTAGYYSLGFVYRQNTDPGGASYRRLTVDGEVPFSEADRVRFPYANGWRYAAYAGGDGDPYLVFLDAGEHTLGMEVTPGGLSEVYDALRTISADMGDVYVDITKIVGETVDIYRSYEIFTQIPDLDVRLTGCVERLDDAVERLSALQGSGGSSSVSILRNAARVVRLMLDNRYTAHRYKSEFYDAYTNLSSLMGGLTDMPLDIDRIVLTGAGAPSAQPHVTLWERIGFSVQRFLHSFGSDYRAAAADGELTIWVNWGRDQAQVLNSLVQDNLVRDTGLWANVSIVNASLIQAMLAGSGPDVLLQLPRTDPVNYAMRGALLPLDGFDGLDEVLQRFNDGAADPYRYDGKLYALPDTQSFYLMYLRTDILAQMGIRTPETWDELIEISDRLQRSDLQVYVNGQSIFTTLLLQNGLSLYTDDLTAGTMTDTATIRVFSQMTEWFTKHKLPVTADLYNRFRVGSMPIGISDHTLYTQLCSMAPEIDGRWTVAPLPGVRRADGTVERCSAGTGTGCAITKLTKDPEKAWRFLQWWTSKEIQSAYPEKLTSAIGPLGRIAVANNEAFAAMDWDDTMREVLLGQQHDIAEIPEVPGGYYTSRCLTQAFWEVVEQGKPAMEAMIRWGTILDNEIARKRAEYLPAAG